MKQVHSLFDPDHKERHTQFLDQFGNHGLLQIYKSGVEVGVISKKWSGLLKETFSVADNFGIRFPVAATTEEKNTWYGISD